ncbi:hypothetical protein LY622_13715 [Halomonas sp. M5N1S17]|uniref:hypothetical protein n=1 Tax=Halomonas alkalisoli TaxID=2907158 RepID=UPI001F20E42D|nr:hypothetical protein [Halomonas alkalisoli]MCE9664491.1 hypothetical protein [Halomonas alkalisoli]
MNHLQQATNPGPIFPQFRLIEFNPRRASRGAEAARVEVTYSEGDMDELWMSPRDIRNNIREFGQQEGLQKALEAYGKGGRG